MSDPSDIDDTDEVARLAEQSRRLLEAQEELDRVEWLGLAKRVGAIEARELERADRVRNCLNVAEEALAEARRAIAGMEQDRLALARLRKHLRDAGADKE